MIFGKSIAKLIGKSSPLSKGVEEVKQEEQNLNTIEKRQEMSFGFRNIGHYIAVAARDIAKFGGIIQGLEPIVEGVTLASAGVAAPSAIEIERAGFAALGHLTSAAAGVTSVAEGTQTLTISLAASEVNDFKALFSYFQSLATKQGVKVS
jgi:hypothetical protein